MTVLLIGSVTILLRHLMSVCKLYGRSVGRPVGWLVDWMVGRSIGRSVVTGGKWHFHAPNGAFV